MKDDMRDNALETAAAALAGYAHGSVGQKRKYTNEPYIVHPMEVADIVSSVTEDSRMIAAAWLHDVLEDTGFSLAYIENFLIEAGMSHTTSWTVGQYVYELTEQSKPEDGNRADRKKIDRDFLAKSSPEAATVKLADLISNTASITRHDPNFAKVYMAEKRELLKVLAHGNKTLWDEADVIVSKYFADQREKTQCRQRFILL